LIKLPRLCTAIGARSTAGGEGLNESRTVLAQVENSDLSGTA